MAHWYRKFGFASRTGVGLSNERSGLVGTPEIMAHVLVDTPGGDGQIGELLDRWLLDRPTLVSLRGFRDPILDLWIASLISGIVGAKLLLYVRDLDYNISNPRAILWGLRSAGLFYRGLAAGLAAGAGG